jgi:cytochrome c biogenesis protein CcdA
MTLVGNIAILGIIGSTSIILAELLYRKRVAQWRFSRPSLFIVLHSILGFLLASSVLVLYFDIIGSLWQSAHQFLIVLSAMISFLFGLWFLDRKQDSMGRVERQLWWIDGIIRTSGNPSRKIEDRILKLKETKELNQDEVLRILDGIDKENARIQATVDKLRKMILVGSK